MTPFDALILGIIQGITEFIPVSSSSHLRLAKWLLGIPNEGALLYFDLLCHLGTLIPLIFFLRKAIFETLRDLRKISLFSLALAPLIPAYFLLKPVRIALSDPHYLGFLLLGTAALLFFASSLVKGKSISQPKYTDVLCIGMMQAMALIGISRSGSTISVARMLGWEWVEAARFSFLLGIPAILGGEILETFKLLKGEGLSTTLPMEVYATGFCASLLVGAISVRLVFLAYEKGIVRPFAWYCTGVGLFALIALN